MTSTVPMRIQPAAHAVLGAFVLFIAPIPGTRAQDPARILITDADLKAAIASGRFSTIISATVHSTL
jgi:hypothetical protein